MEYFINDRLQMVPNASKEEMEAMYMSERLKRKVHKKGPAPKLLGNERCEICGHLANGFHYNVLSCEGCKGFFRRTIINGIEYTCKTGRNECDLRISIARQRCQKCRILKCLKAGMNPHFVRKRKDDTTVGPYESARKISRPSVIINKMPVDQEKLLTDLKLPWQFLNNAPQDMGDIRESNSFIEYIDCIKVGIMEHFMLKLDDFKVLPAGLQTEIISRTSNELVILHLSRYFQEEYQVLRLENVEIDAEILSYSFNVDDAAVKRIFYYWNKHASLLDKEYDQTTCAVIAGVILFAPDRGYDFEHYNNRETSYTDYHQVMRDLQEKHINLLQSYLERHRSFQKSIFVEIVMMLTTLREVNHEMQRLSSRQLMMLIHRSLIASQKQNLDLRNSLEAQIAEGITNIKIESEIESVN